MRQSRKQRELIRVLTSLATQMSQVHIQNILCFSPRVEQISFRERSTEFCPRVHGSRPFVVFLSCFLSQCFNGDPPFLSGVPHSSTATVLSRCLRTVESTTLIQSRCPRTWPANDHRRREGVRKRCQPKITRNACRTVPSH